MVFAARQDGYTGGRITGMTLPRLGDPSRLAVRHSGTDAQLSRSP